MQSARLWLSVCNLSAKQPTPRFEQQEAVYTDITAGNLATSYLKLTPASIKADNSYFAQSSVAYSGAQAEKLEKIRVQKWISLCLVSFEAWSEWRRTGIPNIPVGPVGPGYVLYPADELRINEANYRLAVAWLGADDLKTHIWWNK